jgi:CRP-like cAMP-binding protein
VRSEVTRYPDALLKVIEHISEVNRFLIGWALGATLQSPERRLAYMLAVLSRRTSRIAGSRQASITQEQIGGLGFGSRQRVARLLQSLEQRGLVETSYGSVFVPSWEGLNAFALA